MQFTMLQAKWPSFSKILYTLWGTFLLGMSIAASAESGVDRLKLEVVSPLKRIFLSMPVVGQQNPFIELWAARNEYETLQVAFRADEIVRVTAVEMTNLSNGKGGTLSADFFEYRFPDYVQVRKHTPRTPAAELEGDPPDWFPDPLESSRGVEFKNSRALWGTWYVPPDTAAGDYRGELTIRFEGGVRRLPVLLHVWDFTLPEKPSLYVTNWLHISQVESQYRVKRGSAAFWQAIEKIAQDMVAHRQNVIFTPLNLIKSLEQPDGSYRFDFRDYDKWVGIFLQHGFQVFEGSHLFHSRNSYDIRRLQNRAPEEPEFGEKQLATAEGQGYLKQLLLALHEENGKLGIQSRYIQHVADEAKPAQLLIYRDIAAIVHAAMPGVAIIDATELPPSNAQGLMDIPVPLMGNPIYPLSAGIGAKWGRWWYTCVVPNGRFPNRFIDYPLVKMRIIPWLSWRNNVKGYLHYGYNWWFTPSGKYPRQDVEHGGKAPPGDGFVVYPPNSGKDRAPVSSLRWETFRDGMEDYEYLILLDQVRAKLSLFGGDGKRDLVRRQVESVYRDVQAIIGGPEAYPRSPETLAVLRKRTGQVLDLYAREQLGTIGLNGQ